jgi:hypothetical protein
MTNAPVAVVLSVPVRGIIDLLGDEIVGIDGVTGVGSEITGGGVTSTDAMTFLAEQL